MAGARAPAWQGWDRATVRAGQPPASGRLRRTGRRGWEWRTLALTGGVALVALLGLASLMAPPANPPAEPPVAAPSAPSWHDIDHPVPLFALAGSPYALLPMDYAARRRTPGTGREDWLTFGDPGHPGPWLRLVVSRRSPVPQPSADLVVDFARLAATAGHAMTRAGLPFGLGTRLGAFETAELNLRMGALTRACLGFRLQDTAGPIGIIGVACGDPDHPPERSTLACALDRIELVAAGDDAAMRSFFTGTDRRPDRGCAGALSISRGVTSAAGPPLPRGT